MAAEIENVEIRAPARLHFTLTNLSDFWRVVNGGLGMCIEQPQWIIQASHIANNLVLGDAREVSTDYIAQAKVKLDQLAAVYHTKGTKVDIQRSISPHVGLGSKTAFILAITESFLHLHNIPHSREEIVQASNRGRTSGIGVNTYFDGGVIFDIGQPKTNTELRDGIQSFAPSSRAIDRGRPIVLWKDRMPQDWPMWLIQPVGVGLSNLGEVAFFNAVCPLFEDEVGEVTNLILYQIIPSIAIGDYSSFCTGINNLQRLYWKDEEIANYGKEMRELIRFLQRNGADCAGMTSTGPTIYCFSRQPQEMLEAVKKENRWQFASIQSTSPRNTGRTLIVDGKKNIN